MLDSSLSTGSERLSETDGPACEPSSRGPITPFLKWAGGKRWLTHRFPDIFPHDCVRHVEPFLGSGAVFFHRAPSLSHLADANPDLIGTFLAVRDYPSQVFANLKQHHTNHSDSYYYRIRALQPRSDVARAARFIYLNRTCWNGLYRVNKSGHFNVPKGTKRNVVFPEDDFDAISVALQNARIECANFRDSLRHTKKGDFVFCDPPYAPLVQRASFTKYTSECFYWEEQVELAERLISASKTGAKVLCTNAPDRAILALYEENFYLTPVSRNRVISGASASRKQIHEVLIHNYELPEGMQGNGKA